MPCPFTDNYLDQWDYRHGLTLSESSRPNQSLWLIDMSPVHVVLLFRSLGVALRHRLEETELAPHFTSGRPPALMYVPSSFLSLPGTADVPTYPPQYPQNSAPVCRCSSVAPLMMGEDPAAATHMRPYRPRDVCLHCNERMWLTYYVRTSIEKGDIPPALNIVMNI